MSRPDDRAGDSVKNVRCFMSGQGRVDGGGRWPIVYRGESNVTDARFYGRGEEPGDMRTGVWGRRAGALLLIVALSIFLWALIIGAVLLIANIL